MTLLSSPRVRLKLFGLASTGADGITIDDLRRADPKWKKSPQHSWRAARQSGSLAGHPPLAWNLKNRCRNQVPALAPRRDFTRPEFGASKPSPATRRPQLVRGPNEGHGRGDAGRAPWWVHIHMANTPGPSYTTPYGAQSLSPVSWPGEQRNFKES